jgi:hypothetical protein
MCYFQILAQQSPDYPTFGSPTLPFIRRVVSERLKLIPSCENNDDIINIDEEHQLTDNGMADLVNHAGDDDLKDDNQRPENVDRMSHSEGLNSVKTALPYVEQQREATATDVLLLSRWRDLAAKKRKEAQKQIPITNFLKKQILSRTNLQKALSL